MINMVMSIVHRITGAALYFGTLLLAAWLVAAAMGEKQFALVNNLFGHPLGKLVLFGYTWALFHHMLGGLRHFLWDTGRGLADLAGQSALVADHHRLRLADAGDLGYRPQLAGEGCEMSLPHARSARSAGSAPPRKAPSISGSSA